MSKCLFLPPLLHPLEALTSYQAPTEAELPRELEQHNCTRGRRRAALCLEHRWSRAGEGNSAQKWQRLHWDPLEMTQHSPGQPGTALPWLIRGQDSSKRLPATQAASAARHEGIFSGPHLQGHRAALGHLPQSPSTRADTLHYPKLNISFQM